ncbi:hypothetical protein [Desulforamulus putei]|uniref:Bypass of forespore C C-terminal domain-containing protein n=1 Tax=Desulforamulus putei DSM 12395 TaxID=1121429 RepID=A0A1M4SPF7_9FIRM|nr:hypothetical protein [Desulforamulus putei]SHE34133.1 hypothetical protein SAMN02745133_00193 [Desulforamulus putei DSM 12395]
MISRFLWIGVGGFLAVLLFCIAMVGGRVTGDGTKAAMSILQVFAQQVQPTLAPDLIIREENVYLCGDSEEIARKTAGSLGVKTEKELKEKYHAPGFSVEVRNDEVLVRQKVNEFCSYHRSFRHLGIYDNKLAVYQGPLGYHQKLLKVEESIPLNSLSAAFQVKLQQVMDFYHMTPETQAKLRYELEFSNEDALNAILENLDEMQD